MTLLTRRLIPLALAIAAFAALVLPTNAPAAPIDDKRAQAASLEAQINENQQKLSALNEQMNDAQVALDAANETIKQADAAVAAAKARTSELRHIVAQRAVSLYTGAGSEGVGELDTTRASDLSSRQTYTAVAAERDRQNMYELKRSQEELAVRKADAEDARSAAAAQQAQLQSQRAEFNAADQKLRSLKSGIDGEIAQLLAQAEQDRLARERAAAAASASARPATPIVSSGGSESVNATPPPSSGSVGAVMSYAYAQLGKPYCYAGAGPSCFDCSGLTMMAWAQAGVSMPHGSNAQLAMFPRGSMNQLQVGDLVYWTDHVGIYVGGNQVLHAPHTGTVVQITTIWSGVIGANRPG